MDNLNQYVKSYLINHDGRFLYKALKGSEPSMREAYLLDQRILNMADFSGENSIELLFFYISRGSNNIDVEDIYLFLKYTMGLVSTTKQDLYQMVQYMGIEPDGKIGTNEFRKIILGL
jgi:hypothetical protein